MSRGSRASLVRHITHVKAHTNEQPFSMARPGRRTSMRSGQLLHPLSSHTADTQPFDFSFEREDSTNGMRNLIIDEVRSFRHLVRQQSIPAQPSAHPQRKESQDLPPPPAGATAQPGAGMGPAYGGEGEVGDNEEVFEEPSSALERQLGQHRIA